MVEPVVLNGDCLAVMASMTCASIDAIVTDPPYELGFMGRKWDSSGVAFDPSTWVAALRVLKPGGHLVAFGAPRSYHRLACAIEDAGFEVRDSIFWCFGSGFPKSLNVSKEIHKQDGVCRCAAGEDHMPCLRDGEDHPACVEEKEQERLLQPILPGEGPSAPSCAVRGEHEGAEAERPALRSGEPGMEGWRDPPEAAGQLRQREIRQMPAGVLVDGEDGRVCDGAPSGHGAVGGEATVAGGVRSPQESSTTGKRSGKSRTVAGQPKPQVSGTWPLCGRCGKPIIPDGLGTALKPAYEPIILARKPLIGTVAENVLAHGTGALNIDACRVEVTGQRPYILQSWEQEPRLCASCAALAADSVKRATPETKEFTAEKPVAPITSDEEKSSPGVTDSGAIGCSDGTRADATSTSLNTSKCGKTPTDPCQTGTKSTTETETRATTNSAICRSCLKPITDDCTPSSMSGEKSGLSQGETRHAPIGRDGEPSANKTYAKNGSTNFAATPGPRGGSPAGRWPANFVHDGSEDVLAGFPVTGPSKSGLRGTQQRHDVSSPETARPKAGTNTVRGIDDAGGSAARFFYCAKAGKNDRAGSKHPTVKPIALMRWLVRLITPPGGVVLDPFAGSGTTGQAAMEEGFDAILIEREPEYVADIKRRMEFASKQEALSL